MKLRLDWKRCEMDLEGRSAAASLVLMGLFFFLRVLYYFGVVNLKDVGVGELICSGILPMVLAVGYLVLLRCVKWNAPLAYGGFGVLFCVFLIVWGFSMDGAVHIVFHTLFLVLGIAALAGICLELLDSRIWSCVPMALCLAYRFFIFDLPRLTAFRDIPTLVTELSILSLLGWLCCLAAALKPRPKEPEADTQ